MCKQDRFKQTRHSAKSSAVYYSPEVSLLKLDTLRGNCYFQNSNSRTFTLTNPLSPKGQTDLSSNVHVFPRLDCIRVLREFAMHRFPSQYKRTATNPRVRPGKCGCWCSPRKGIDCLVIKFKHVWTRTQILTPKFIQISRVSRVKRTQRTPAPWIIPDSRLRATHHMLGWATAKRTRNHHFPNSVSSDFLHCALFSPLIWTLEMFSSFLSSFL